MSIDGDSLISQQLSIKNPILFDLGDNKTTLLNPVHYVPCLDNTENKVSLDGEWRLIRWPFKKKEALLAGSATIDSKWPVIAQPGKVFYQDPQQNPATVKNWDRVTMSHIDPEDGAIIRRSIKIPASWKGKRVFVRFDGIYPAGRVYLNGVLLGEHLSGLTPVEWDVTKAVTPGREALVAVRLLRRHRFIQLDMPRHSLEFAGLSQTACFYAVEACHISNYHLTSSLDETLASGSISGKIDLTNAALKKRSGSIQINVTDGKGKQIARLTQKVSIEAGQTKSVSTSLTINRPALWNDEFPNLYTVLITSKFSDQADQTISYKTGFRLFIVKDGRATLNGRPVKFRGVNHLTYHPDGGMYTPIEWLRQNLMLMKKANVNAIRTHFLSPRCLGDLCDELGIYLMQELPIDWGTNYIHDAQWVGPELMRVQGGIMRDRHHPSIMVWSIGNENLPNKLEVSEDGFYILRLLNRFAKQLDPSRPTMFPPPGPANKISGIFELRLGDIADTHYSFTLVKDFNKTNSVQNPIAWTAEMETVTREEAMAKGWSGVWFSSEYGLFNMVPDLLNSPYLSVIADEKEALLTGKNTQQAFLDRMKREWGYMRSDPTCLGGGYFPWLCCGSGDNPWGWVLWGEDNDWGVVTADLLPKSFFWVIRNVFSPVWFPQKLLWKKGENDLKFEVTNQFNAIDLDECILRTQMGGSGEWMGSSMRDWRDIPVSCAAGSTDTISIPIWNKGTLNQLEAGHAVICRCTLLDPKGFRVITNDILVMPENLSAEYVKAEMLVGPDAKL